MTVVTLLVRQTKARNTVYQTKMQGSRVLRRVSSLILNSPDTTGQRSDLYQANPRVSDLNSVTMSAKLNEIGDPNTEIVPDSEEERIR